MERLGSILEQLVLRKFSKKKRPIEAGSLPDAEDFTMKSKRRCAKQAAVKARMAARKENDEEQEKEKD